MHTIPIVFAFDDNYALPASIAIQSLLDYKDANTEYAIFVLHGGLKPKTIQALNTIAKITWIKIDDHDFSDAPQGYSALATYYRLIIQDVIPQYDKIIWSDVDVLFQTDLSEVYNTDIDEFEWAGVIAEKNRGTNGIHTRFIENTHEFIYMSGFMLINAKRLRQQQMTKKFLQTIQQFADRLKMFDLDVLNLACTHIASIPFKYCVLENIYHINDISTAPEYPWLSQVYNDSELLEAKQHPAIIHYAGASPKIWWRSPTNIPGYYWRYILASPFYRRRDYYANFSTQPNIYLLKILAFLCPYKPWKKAIKRHIRKLQNLCRES